jgi:hypothetical protein
MTCSKTLFLHLINRLQSANVQQLVPVVDERFRHAACCEESMFREFENRAEKYRGEYHNFMLANRRNYCTAKFISQFVGWRNAASMPLQMRMGSYKYNSKGKQTNMLSRTCWILCCNIKHKRTLGLEENGGARESSIRTAGELTELITLEVVPRSTPIYYGNCIV